MEGYRLAWLLEGAPRKTRSLLVTDWQRVAASWGRRRPV